jgi:hypothetical protein
MQAVFDEFENISFLFRSTSMFLNYLVLATLIVGARSQLDAVPVGFDTSRWAWVSNEDPLLAVIPGYFNRSSFDAPSAANVSDDRVAAM